MPAQNATTPSLEALKAYSMGVDTRVKTGDVQAIPLFEHALGARSPTSRWRPRFSARFTPTCASSSRRRSTSSVLFARSESLSEPERLFIKSQHHYIVTGRLDDVVATFKGVYRDLSGRLGASQQPLDSIAYQRMGQFDDALREARVSAVRLRAEFCGSRISR